MWLICIILAVFALAQFSTFNLVTHDKIWNWNFSSSVSNMNVVKIFSICYWLLSLACKILHQKAYHFYISQ
jgi:hypothetical protein